MSEYKVYVESHNTLYEVINPVFEEDGAVSSVKWRVAGQERWQTVPGTFLNPRVFEHFPDLLQAIVDVIAAGCASETETEADYSWEGNEDPCCGADEACSDCPDAEFEASGESVTVEVPVELAVKVAGFDGQVAEAVNALLDIAEDVSQPASERISAASLVISAYFTAFDIS